MEYWYGQIMYEQESINDMSEWSDKKEIMGRIVDYCFDYLWKIYPDGSIVINSRIKLDEDNTLYEFKKLGRNFEGHFEYDSIEELLNDWLETLFESDINFSDEINFICTMDGRKMTNKEKQKLEAHINKINSVELRH